MASGAAHYKMAEYILDEAKKFMAENLAVSADTDAVLELDEVFDQHHAMIAQAHVHALLANAAASAQNIRRNGPVGIATTGWEDVLGGVERVDEEQGNG